MESNIETRIMTSDFSEARKALEEYKKAHPCTYTLKEQLEYDAIFEVYYKELEAKMNKA